MLSSQEASDVPCWFCTHWKLAREHQNDRRKDLGDRPFTKSSARTAQEERLFPTPLSGEELKLRASQ